MLNSELYPFTINLLRLLPDNAFKVKTVMLQKYGVKIGT